MSSKTENWACKHISIIGEKLGRPFMFFLVCFLALQENMRLFFSEGESMEIRQGEEAVVIGEDLAPFPHFPKRLLR